MLQRLVLAVVVLVVAGPAPAASSAGERCRVAKLVATAVHAAGVVRCRARAIARGSTVSDACLGAADARLARAFARAEEKAPCPPVLDDARAQSIVFVTALLASAQPTPQPTATPGPSPTPASTGCGNGVVESGEQCDGQPFCAPTCSLASPTVCCGPAGFCIEGPFPGLADTCGGQGIPYVLGALCEPSTPPCDPVQGCEGTCRPESTFPPASVCCEMSSGCGQQTIDDSIELWTYVVQQCLLAGGSSVVVGTCAPSGDCAPGS
jgi:hypothetical protein